MEKVVEVPMVGQTLQGTTQEVDIPLAPRREDLGDGILIRQASPLGLSGPYTLSNDLGTCFWK